jgi:hypothetical protein
MRQVARSYNANRGPNEPQLGTGPPPTGLKKLLKDAQLRTELTAAAALCQVLRVIPAHEVALEPDGGAKSVAAAEGMCRAFVLYKKLVPQGHLSLEHLMILVTALARRDSWALERCSRCDSFVLGDPLSLENRLCSECRDIAKPPKVWEPEPVMEVASLQDSNHTGYQHSLF